MDIAILILIAAIFYLSVWATMAYYFVKMNKLEDIDKKLRLTDRSAFAIIIQQVVTLLAVIIFYAVKMNDIEVAVDNAVAIPSASLFAVGFILTFLIDRLYMRKQFPNCAKKRIESEQDQKVSISCRNTFKVGIAVSMMNALFNLMLFGAIAY